ncbi:MAG TPA: hypothetical protein VGE07_00535 [Herpetosiphonaceae bacterium]
MNETITTADGLTLTHGTFVKIWGQFPAVVACNRHGRIVGLVVPEGEYGRWCDYLHPMTGGALAGGHGATMAEWRRWSFSEQFDRESAARAVREKRLPLVSPGRDPRFWLELDPSPPQLLVRTWESLLDGALGSWDRWRELGNPAISSERVA